LVRELVADEVGEKEKMPELVDEVAEVGVDGEVHVEASDEVDDADGEDSGAPQPLVEDEEKEFELPPAELLLALLLVLLPVGDNGITGAMLIEAIDDEWDDIRAEVSVGDRLPLSLRE
jgi:hypothetical protein